LYSEEEKGESTGKGKKNRTKRRLELSVCMGEEIFRKRRKKRIRPGAEERETNFFLGKRKGALREGEKGVAWRFEEGKKVHHRAGRGQQRLSCLKKLVAALASGNYSFVKEERNQGIGSTSQGKLLETSWVRG